MAEVPVDRSPENRGPTESAFLSPTRAAGLGAQKRPISTDQDAVVASSGSCWEALGPGPRPSGTGKRTQERSLELVFDRGQGPLVRQFARPHASLLQVRDDPLGPIGCDACVGIARRRAGNLVTIQLLPQCNRSDYETSSGSRRGPPRPRATEGRGHDPHQRISVRIASAASSARSPAARQSR
jgi:hypothetical protein